MPNCNKCSRFYSATVKPFCEVEGCPVREASFTALLAEVRAAAEKCAIDVYKRNGWRKVPAQCPVCSEAIRGKDHADVMKILTAWTDAYQAKCSYMAELILEADQ